MKAGYSSIRNIPRKVPQRRGATAVETALVMLAFLILVFGMLELGMTVFQRNIVSHAARQGARRAIVRGELAPPELSAWGPAAYDSPADSDHEIAQVMAPFLAGLDLSRTNIQMQWIDGNNEIDSRVRVTVTTARDPFLTFLFTDSWTLTGESTMPIAH